jgi:hypothetical protein
MAKKKTYILNHIPIKQVWLEKKIILIKDVQKWVDQKNLTNPMKQKNSFNIKWTKVQKVGTPKNEGVKKIYHII